MNLADISPNIPPGTYRNENLDPYEEGKPFFLVSGNGSIFSWVGYQLGVVTPSFSSGLHRLEGPAMIARMADGSIAKKWCRFGKLHRLDGPALEHSNETEDEFWVNGQQISKSDFPIVAQKHKDKIITDAANIVAKDKNIAPILEKLIDMRPDKSDKIKVLMDVCAEWGL